jgi:hypothetical protein
MVRRVGVERPPLEVYRVHCVHFAGDITLWENGEKSWGGNAGQDLRDMSNLVNNTFRKLLPIIYYARDKKMNKKHCKSYTNYILIYSNQLVRSGNLSVH